MHNCTSLVACRCSADEKKCGDNEFMCVKAFQCIAYHKKHDGYRDCLDGSDEAGHGQFQLFMPGSRNKCKRNCRNKRLAHFEGVGRITGHRQNSLQCADLGRTFTHMN